MKTTALIVRDDQRLQISFTETAQKLKADALAVAGLVGRVTNPSENERAVQAQTGLNDLVKLVERARKEVKEPVLTFGRQIDDAAKSFVLEANEELTRVSELLGSFQALESARVRAAETLRRLEAEKLESDKKAEQQRILDAQQAEQRKLDKEAQEASERLQAAKNAKSREAIIAQQAEIEKQRALATAKSHEALDAVQEHFDRKAADLPVATAARAKGQVVKNDWTIEVTDKYLLAKFHPTCVNIEPRLTDIKELLKAGVEVKGIRATPIVNSNVRAGSGGKAIEV